MIRMSWRTELPQLLVIAAMFVAAIATLPTAPDRIPLGWDARGDVTRTADPLTGLLLVPTLAAVAYVLMALLPRVDPGRANYATFSSTYNVIRLALVLFLGAVYLLIHLALRGARVDPSLLVQLGVAVVLFVIGNVIGKVRPNWFVGVRTPWTLSSKTTWVRTHRLAGPVMIVTAFAFAASAVIRAPIALTAAVIIGVGGTLLLIVYSYLVWREAPDKIAPSGTLPAE